MAMGIFPEIDENALYISRYDPQELLGSCSPHAFLLEELEWPSVEHYFHAMKFTDPEYQKKILQAAEPKKAKSLGRSRRHKIRKDWSEVKEVIMTRAVYTKCRAHEEVSTKLLETEDRKIVCAMQYDYFWGVGRDRRGENAYGKVLMRVRDKLRSE